MRTALAEAMYVAPVSTAPLSTDAQRTPETFWLAVRWGRRVLGDALDAAAAGSDLSADEARWAGARILFDSAADLYGAAAS